MSLGIVTDNNGLSSSLNAHLVSHPKKGCCCPCLKKVGEVAKEILMGLCHAFLFAINPTIYAISFVAALIFNKHMSLAVERIKNIWNTSSWGMRVLGSVLGGVGAFLSLPITLATASWLFATQLSCRLVQRAEEALHPRPLLPISC